MRGQPFTIPKHRTLLDEINEMSIRIKAHYLIEHEDPEKLKKLRDGYPAPSWTEIENLFMRSYSAINEQREDPRKY